MVKIFLARLLELVYLIANGQLSIQKFFGKNSRFFENRLDPSLPQHKMRAFWDIAYSLTLPPPALGA